MAKHHKQSPSGSALRVACPGSFRMQEGLPFETNDAAQEGTLAHEIASDMLLVNYGKTQHIPAVYSKHEMREHIQIYIDHITSIVPLEKSEDLHVEEKLHIPAISHDCFGTPDAWFYDEEKNEVNMWDFKYGYAPVEVKENWQLIAYASGVCIELINTHLNRPEILLELRHLKIRMHIVQPRAQHDDGPIRTWSLTWSEFTAYEDRLSKSEELARQTDAPLIAGDHCKYCRARHGCPAFQSKSQEIAEQALTAQYTELTPSQIGSELSQLSKAAKILDSRITSLKDQAIKELKNGGFVAGFALRPSYGRAQWKKDISNIAEAYGVDILKPPNACFISPAQAIKAGIPADIVHDHMEREYLGDRLVEDRSILEIDWSSAE